MKKLLFVTHENIDETQVAKAMFYDVAVSLSSNYACHIISASAAERTFTDNNSIRQSRFSRASRGQVSARDGFAMMGFLVRKSSYLRQFDLYYCRSYPAMFFMASLNVFFRRPIIFDTRGLFFEELFDSGVLKGNKGRRILKRCERWLLRQADKVICVSSAHRSYYQSLEPSKSKYRVVYNCAPVPKVQPALAGEVTIGYVGSLIKWHSPDYMAALLSKLDEIGLDYCFHCVTSDRELAEQKFQNVKKVKVYSHPYRSSPIRFHLGLCLIQPSLSKSVCFPVKVAEYLAGEVPVAFSTNIEACVSLHSEYGIGLPLDIRKSALDNAKLISDYLTGNRGPEGPVTIPAVLRFEAMIAAIMLIVEECLVGGKR